MANVIIWRESTYKTGRCPQCEEVVRDKDGMPKGNTLYDMINGWLYCQRCKNIIARVKEDIRTKKEELKKIHDMLHGYWDEEL